MQLSLFQEDPKKQGSEEPKNFAINYGITIELLDIVFNTKRAGKNIVFQALRHTFHGIWNIDISHELYQYMNPLEIIALYCGAGIVKENDLPFGENRNLEFAELISRLVGAAFKNYNQIFPYAQQHLKHPHTTNKGDLIKRMRDYASQYPEQAQSVIDSFFNTLYLPHPRNIYSNVQGVQSYNDPNIDGKSTKLYIQYILTIISKIYKNNIKKSKK